MFRLYREERNERREERSNWLDAIQEHTAVLRNMRHEVRDVATDGGEDQE
ncbi:structural protein VP7 [Saline Natrinema sp. J7-1 virus 1]|uniref:Structural protein VP7 n=1 Tax=Saline Natrinema sp. J7-1 virus 1 TaxID=2847285 RepID=A0AAE9VQT7_9VIRU|nr:structural protein VP7 [Saline Natrinema sp. J7-1 virus 1]WBE14036.1 structural protein VP7 [Saline Natrinema sp. J7-1 virus 1]